ncbi:amidoligase family protein [Fodinicurvata sp. EGI_FJ10296]|uniref:amidoligase family protein n=1 Tax=Fodinicurvata sp. EGI_FJ10296 TaxID=3231908 RepID=UPI003452B323
MPRSHTPEQPSASTMIRGTAGDRSAVGILPPPRKTTATGSERRVGVEIEFAGMETEEAALAVQDAFGGTITYVDKYARRVETDIGAFAVELDMSRAHPDKKPGKPALLDEMDTYVSSAVGAIGRYWMPQEIAAPPIPFSRLYIIDDLVAALRKRGALGTSASPIYGFGIHLNPEVPDTSRETILAHLKAYLLCSDWLHERIDMDVTRRLMRFVAPLPNSYTRMVVDPDYDPSLPDLMVDYFRFNPTRNREFDMLPIFGFIDPRRVRMLSSGKSVSARPTFHYRLPDSRVDRTDWGGIVAEWNNWVHVEWLASDADALAAAGRRWAALYDRGRVSEWKHEVASWLVEPCGTRSAVDIERA